MAGLFTVVAVVAGLSPVLAQPSASVAVRIERFEYRRAVRAAHDQFRTMQKAAIKTFLQSLKEAKGLRQREEVKTVFKEAMKAAKFKRTEAIKAANDKRSGARQAEAAP